MTQHMTQHETIGLNFEVKMRTTLTLSDGARKSVSHALMVEAFNFGQAERYARQACAVLWSDEATPFATSIRITSRKEYLSHDEAEAGAILNADGRDIHPGTWYQTIVEWRETDPDTARERRQRKAWLVSTAQGTDSVSELIAAHLHALGITEYKLRRIELTDIEAVVTLK